MSVSTVIASAALLASVSHGAQFNVTAGPAVTPANPGQSVVQKITNHGTMRETITVAVDEIGHVTAANGRCGFTHAAPLVTSGLKSFQLAPGDSARNVVRVAPTGPAGYHDITVAYSIAGTGSVRVSEGVATVVAVTYPGTPSAASSSPCIAVAQTPTPSAGNPAIGAGAFLAFLSGLAFGSYRIVRRVRRRRAARRLARHRAA